MYKIRKESYTSFEIVKVIYTVFFKSVRLNNMNNMDHIRISGTEKYVWVSYKGVCTVWIVKFSSWFPSRRHIVWKREQIKILTKYVANVGLCQHTSCVWLLSACRRHPLYVSLLDSYFLSSRRSKGLPKTTGMPLNQAYFQLAHLIATKHAIFKPINCKTTINTRDFMRKIFLTICFYAQRSAV